MNPTINCCRFLLPRRHLYACCLMLMFGTLVEATAIPFGNDTPYSVVWNSKTWPCEDKLGVPLDLAKYGIIANSNETWQGDKVTILNHLIGLYPYFRKDDGEPVNGGIPQLTNLTGHFEKVVNDIMVLLPDANYDGLAVIDWEYWRPTWERNWDRMLIYQNKSLDLVRQRHPNWSDDLVEIVAKNEFETAAKMLMEGTLKVARDVRPRALWGFYGFPDCYNHEGQSECSVAVQNVNDNLQWLFDASTAVYPSIYLSYKMPNAKGFVFGTLNEARRLVVQSPTPQTPIYPYTRYNYSRSAYYLTDVDLGYTIGQSMKMGMPGIVIWGDYLDGNNRQSCLSLQLYLDEMLGPYIADVINQAVICSKTNCNDHGRCVQQSDGNYGNDVGGTLHKDLQLISKNKIADTRFGGLKQLYFNNNMESHYTCECYPGWHGDYCDKKWLW
ncbi:hyaluronidase-1-like [Glandiceps talaboti]